MAIDYSKWDKIELSDDSDVEVHPNVDKKSFIKWKQQSIHEKRFQRNQDIKNLETQVSMYGSLNKRVDKMLGALKDEQLADKSTVTKFLNENFDKTEKSQGDNVDPEIATFNEMVEDLLDQLKRDAIGSGKNPNDGSVIRGLIQQHRKKIDDVTVQANEKLKELYKEKQAHISSEDIHTGFDSSFMNAYKKEEERKAKELEQSVNKVSNEQKLEDLPKTLAKPQQVQEKALQSVDGKGVAQSSPEGEDEEDFLKLFPETEEFSKISVGDPKESARFLTENYKIINEQQKDALMMKAFESQLKHDEKRTYQILYQSEILAFIESIYSVHKSPVLDVPRLINSIEMFFKRVLFEGRIEAAKAQFLDSVNTKFEHVKKRCLVLEEEEKSNGAQGVETIQLKTVDESTQIEFELPDFESKEEKDIERVKIFKQLPENLQKALKTKDLDTVNDAFADLSIEVAEHALDLLGEADIIKVAALLENEEEFKHLQEEYKQEHQMENLNIDEKPETIQEEEQSSKIEEVDTADLVD
ncbi:Hsp90 co-chaperone Cdc37 [Nakaseomyces bracarensis]|uniref:Hsp90 chaperone protein kinase-targeting subunit n=1 Tax=Nakaseomyces bracarensis TaxID=273131 RepID=A0ABR4NT13_9SACH